MPQKPVTNPVTPPVTTNTTITNPTPAVINKPATDTITNKPVQPVVSPFNHTPDGAHFVVLVLTKVDNVFVNEAKNAFFRYSRENYINKLMTTELVNIDTDNKLLLMSPFKNANEAIAFIDRAKPVTATEIIPWLKGGRYSYLVITEKNLDLLKANKDIENYKNFINQYFPGKF